MRVQERAHRFGILQPARNPDANQNRTDTPAGHHATLIPPIELLLGLQSTGLEAVFYPPKWIQRYMWTNRKPRFTPIFY